MGIKFEGQVLKFGTVDKCNRKFAPDCKITFPEKIPVAYNFDMDEIVEPINQKILIDQLAARIPHTDQATTHEKEHSTMTINEYQALALRTESRITTDPVPYIRVLEGLMGLNGEAGEAIDLMKKVLFQGHEFDREHMAKELGDIAWYLAVSADAIGYDLESILQMNVDKLRARYPDGFSMEQSLHRSANDI